VFIIPPVRGAESTLSGVALQGGVYCSDSIPDYMSPGQHGQYLIEFRNTGMMAWEHDVEKIGVEYSGNSPYIEVEPRIQLLPKRSRVHSGQSYQFPFTISARATGHADLVFSVVRVIASGKTIPISDPVTLRMNITEGSQISREETGTIQVSAGPLHLPVTLDGMLKGTTPLTLSDITVGPHHITIEGKEGIMETDVEVKRNSIQSVTYSPDKTILYIETKESLLFENSNPILTMILSNFFFALGLICALTCAAVVSVLILTGRIKKAKLVIYQALPSPFQKKECHDYAIETRRNLLKEQILFDPIAGLFRQGDIKSLKIKVTNLGRRSIIIDNIQIKPGECRILLREITDDMPGDRAVVQQITYTDGDGKEKKQDIHLQYRIKPKNVNISWVFERFIRKNGKIVAVLKIKNHNSFTLETDSGQITSGEEKEIELEMEDLQDDEPSVFRNIRISLEHGEPFSLSVHIPYNRGIMLFFAKEYEKSLEWFHQQLASGTKDPVFKRYRDLIEKKVQKYGKRGVAESPSPKSGGPYGIGTRADDTHIFSSSSSSVSVSGFPASLYSFYTPSALISSDRLGLVYRAMKASDNEEVAVRVLDSVSIPPSQVELQIQAWRSLKHQNIMRIKFWERDPVYFMEFDLPSGAVQSKKRIYSLTDLKVPIPLHAALRIVRGLAEGIDYIHRQGVRHYLLEPSVIFLDKGLNPKISGFDTAALVQSGIPEGCWVAAPEQYDPEKYGNPGKKTDIYQVGAIFYYLITGHTPVCAESSNILPFSLRSDYQMCDAIIGRSLTIDKNDRYGEIREMIQDLDALLRSFKR
ncbi:MAG TPA: PEGA domain-containing protein, partial [Methanospirillum sp.]|uniref:protein kinase domain-containing protein n=1 Tax=Methanospirillum sp. TaxID=45200 RepID=UPI002B5507B3